MNIGKYVGLPFIDRKSDCITLIKTIYKNELGIEIPDMMTSAYDSKKAFSVYQREISSNWLKLDTPQKYCVIAMATIPEHPKIIQHFGMYLCDNKMLHTLDKIGSHITDLKNYKHFIRGYYSWKAN